MRANIKLDSDSDTHTLWRDACPCSRAWNANVQAMLAALRRFAPVIAIACSCTLWLFAPIAQADAPDAFPAAVGAPHHQTTLDGSRELHVDPGFLPTLAAVVPGLILHGSGAFVAGDRPLAKRLALIEAADFGLFLTAAAVVYVTGTSRRLVGTFAPVIALTGGVFLLGWLADIYAASTGGRDVRAAPFSAPVEAELGYRYVYDPQFQYRNFSYVRADFRERRLRVSPSAWLALDDNNQRVQIESAARALGRVAGRRSSDGSYLDGVSAFIYHHHGSERFSVYTGELRLDGRLDLSHVGHSLRGAFVEGQLGAALEFYDFQAVGAEARNDASGLLLARFGFGLYLGDSAARTGEVLVYYDHRHDDYAAGMGVAGIGSGVLGHVGASAHYYVTPSLALTLLCEVGSASVTGLGLRYRLARPGRELL
jgi:hypothetical protein